MSETRIYLATAIDKEVGSATYYVMDAEKFSRILDKDIDGIETTLAEIEEQTPAQIFTLVADLVAYLKEHDLEIAEEAVGVFTEMGAEWPAPGSEDTELGVLMEPEVGHGETEVYAGVQA